MRIGLTVHGRRSDALGYARAAAAFLHREGVIILAEDEYAAQLGANVTPFSQAVAPADVIIALGGDGTLLRGAQYAVKWNALLLGINLGRVGFLTEIEPDGLEEALRCVLSGSYEVDHRSVLKVESGGQTWYGLNDAVITRGGYARLITINALVDGNSAGHYVADGLVVATPTGSTGYSLSAGGPIVAPQVDCMVITPVCAHTLQHRPAVVGGDSHIRLELLPDAEQTASLQVDGQSCATLTAGMYADITKDHRQLHLIRIKPLHFFQLVRDKLTEWSR